MTTVYKVATYSRVFLVGLGDIGGRELVALVHGTQMGNSL